MEANTASTHKPMGGIDQVDSIVLVYDLDRLETFYRLENHWLPLIERCYNGELPVIVAGNKMDLNRTGMTDEQALARSRQQIVSLMQRFRFIRQCIKCSAKNLLRVDEVFTKAQQAVLYPFLPLYNLNTGRLTENCKRALTRIFRMYDKDYDGLLSNAELDAFQYQTFHIPLVERDVSGWKKVVSRNNPTDEAVIEDGKFTVAGFLAIFDVFISQNRLDVPWRVLRKFGYDDELRLEIPPTVTTPSEDKQSWKLTPSARRFLSATFQQFDSDHDGILSSENVAAIFSIVSESSLPPWHPVRASTVFKGCFSLPKNPPVSAPDSPRSDSAETPMAFSQSLSASGITIISGTSLPTVDMSTLSQSQLQPLSYLDWMGKWHMVAAISPSAARAELYRLGHTEDRRKESKRRMSRRKTAPSRMGNRGTLGLPSREVRILVLGASGGITNTLVRMDESVAVGEGKIPETSSAHVTLKKEPPIKSAKLEIGGEEIVVHLIFTEVPPVDEEKRQEQQQELALLVGPSSKMRAFDLVVFTFDCTKEDSLSYVTELESSILNEEIPRVFVASNVDSEDAKESVLSAAAAHCADQDLESPLRISSVDSTTGTKDSEDRLEKLTHLAKCALQESGLEELKSRPHAEQKRKEAAKRRKMIWLGGLVSVSVAVAVGVGVLWGGVKGEKKDRLGWLRHLFGKVIVGGGTTEGA